MTNNFISLEIMSIGEVFYTARAGSPSIQSLMTADIGDFRASPGRGMTWLMPARRYTVDGRRAPAGRQGHMLKVKHE